MYDTHIWGIVRHVARRGHGGQPTTLNIRPGAVTTLNFFHVLFFDQVIFPVNKRGSTRKSTKETTSGNGYAKEREKQTIVAKKQLVIMQAVIGAHCKNFEAIKNVERM